MYHVLVFVVQVFSATGLDIVSRTRVEHLPEAERSKHKSMKLALLMWLQLRYVHVCNVTGC